MAAKCILFFLSAAFFFLPLSVSLGQVETVPLENPVYDFLKLMSVKKVIPTINDDNPNLSKGQVADFLRKIDEKKSELSSVEKSTLGKYKNTFLPELMNDKNTDVIFGGTGKFGDRMVDFFSKKQKYLYVVNKENFTNFTNLYGHLYYGKEFKPSDSSTALFDGGLRTNGTAYKHFGYSLKFNVGGLTGSKGLARKMMPELNSNFKFNENLEKLSNYDYIDGYVNFYTEPAEDMNISVQIGREKIKYGFGYSDRLMLSGLANDLDFVKFGFHYGVINYSSVVASGVGYYSVNRDSNYTKYISLNRLKLAFPDLFDIGFYEAVVYSDRFDIGYINPLGFYKLIEMSLQDRDNGLFGIDIQTHFLRNIQFQGAFLLDENIVFQLSNLNLSSNKTAYQVGAMVYEPFGLKDLSFILEYTKIRPYVYSHINRKNNFTNYGVILGSAIGPNSDRIYTKLAYNISAWVSISLEYQKIRKGKNIYDANGNLIKNVGGDEYIPYVWGVDPEETDFLDGQRINSDVATVNFRFEPFRNFIFDVIYAYRRDVDKTFGGTSDASFGFIRMTLDY